MRFTRFQLAVHVAALVPLALLLWDAFNQNLTVNPIQAATIRTGRTALTLLLFSLACTPVSRAAKFCGSTMWRQALKVRRALGLYAFGYAAIHLIIFAGVDYGWDLGLIWLELAEKRYVLVGFAAFLILLALAVTSTRGWQQRLGKGWKRLHKAVYAAGVLAIVHFIWAVKADLTLPLIYAAALGLLLSTRNTRVREAVAQAVRKRGHL